MSQDSQQPHTCAYPLDPLASVMARLRGPNGCPWDREQDHRSLRPFMIEEAYEVVDAIESGDTSRLVEELGDVLLQVVFHSRLGEEAGRFTLNDVIQSATDKMVRRHPHVFGDVEAADSAAVLKNWEKIKAEETEKERARRGPTSLLADVSRHLPALVEAEKVQARAARVGFEWPDVTGAIEKAKEEWEEVAAARREGDPRRVQEEWGDLLFALVNVARYWKLDSELALRDTTQRFRRRFAHIEARARAEGRSLETMSLDEMDALWEAAKAQPESNADASTRP